jgi:hypothetical protein
MYDAMHRVALGALFIVGLATLASLGQNAGESVAVQHRQLLLAIVAAALLAAAWLPAVRLPAAAAGIVAKGSLVAVLWAASPGAGLAASATELLQLLALLLAGGILIVEARLEARWNGVLPLQQEG